MNAAAVARAAERAGAGAAAGPVMAPAAGRGGGAPGSLRAALPRPPGRGSAGGPRLVSPALPFAPDRASPALGRQYGAGRPQQRRRVPGSTGLGAEAGRAPHGAEPRLLPAREGEAPPPPLPSGCGVSESARRAQFPFGVSAAVLRISIIKSLNLAVGGKRVPLRAGGPGVRAAHCLVPPSLGAGGMRWKGRSRRAEPRTRPCQRGSDPLRAEQTRIGCDIAAMSQQRHRSHSRAASRRSHRTRCGSMAAPWGSPVLTSGVHWWWRWILALMMKFVG